MRVINAAGAGAAALAILMMHPMGLAANAHGGGFGAHFSHFGHPFRSHFRGAFSQRPFYGGYIDVPPFGYSNATSFVFP